MAKLNRSKVLKSVNETLTERGSSLRIRYSSEWHEYRVKDTNVIGDTNTYHTSSLIDAIETANAMHRDYGY